MLTEEVKIIASCLSDFLLLPCGANGSSEIHIEFVSILSVLVGTESSSRYSQC